MFTVRKKFEIDSHEVIDFVRLIGRFGLKFKVSDEYVTKVVDDKPAYRYRCFMVFGTRRQIAELQEAVDIVYQYHGH